VRVLIAVDGSEPSTRAVRSVADREWPPGTEFMVLSVAESPYLEYGLYPPPEGILATIHQHLERLVKSDVAILQSRFPAAAITGKVVEGTVKYMIVETARNWNADLIVMGSHGRRGLNRLLLGSVAESVLHLAPCSIEIIKEKQPAGKTEQAEQEKVAS